MSEPESIFPELRTPLLELHQQAQRALNRRSDIEAIGNSAFGWVRLVVCNIDPADMDYPEQEQADFETELLNYIKWTADNFLELVRQGEELKYGERAVIPEFNFVFRKIVPKPDWPGDIESVLFSRPIDDEPLLTFTTIKDKTSKGGSGSDILHFIVESNDELLGADAAHISDAKVTFTNECTRVFGPVHIIQYLLVGEFDETETAGLLQDLHEQVDEADGSPEIRAKMHALLDELPAHITRDDATMQVDGVLVQRFAGLIASLPEE